MDRFRLSQVLCMYYMSIPCLLTVHCIFINLSPDAFNLIHDVEKKSNHRVRLLLTLTLILLVLLV